MLPPPLSFPSEEPVAGGAPAEGGQHEKLNVGIREKKCREKSRKLALLVKPCDLCLIKRDASESIRNEISRSVFLQDKRAGSHFVNFKFECMQ